MSPELDPWSCDQPVHENVPAWPWLGMVVVSRPDGGGWPLEAGTVAQCPGQTDSSPWFLLINERHPDGLKTHTQEVYPPGFAGCDLPCCASKIRQNPLVEPEK